MLSREVLNEQYCRLHREYGKRGMDGKLNSPYSKERIRLIHDSLGDITEKDLDKLISKLIKRCLRPPLEEEFLKYYAEVREDNRLEEIKISNLRKSFEGTPLGSVGSIIAQDFSFEELFVKAAEWEFKAEAQWRLDHQERLRKKDKPFFRIGDLVTN